MSKQEFYFDGKRNLFLKLPEMTNGDRASFAIKVPKELEGKYLLISVADEHSGIPVKTGCDESDCDHCHVVYCSVFQEYADLYNVKEE